MDDARILLSESLEARIREIIREEIAAREQARAAIADAAWQEFLDGGGIDFSREFVVGIARENRASGQAEVAL